MKILVDNSNLYAGGGIQVATSFLYDLLKLKDVNKYYIVQSYNSAKEIVKNDFDNRFVFYDLDYNANNIFRRANKVRKIENVIKPDVIFTVFGPSYYKSNYPKVVGFAVGHILYHKSYYFKRLKNYEYLRIKLSNFFKKKFFVANSDALIFETDDARLTYMKIVKGNLPCYTVSNTLNSIFTNVNSWKNIEVERCTFNILYLTANYKHKNIEIIPKIIECLLSYNKRICFKFYISITKEELGFDDKYDEYIEYLGKVEVEKIPSLYSQMNLLLMPTLLEIFSASYLEAMYMGVPIVASDLSFARDICADSALYASAVNADEYADHIVSLYASKELREDLIKKGRENLKRFGTSMDRTLQYLEILKKTVDANNKK